MKIIGLFIVVFAGVATSKLFGFSDMATMVGAVLGAGTYILLVVDQ